MQLDACIEACRAQPRCAVVLPAREKYQLGAREDFRYADMRVEYGKQWWWVSFFVVYILQQVKPHCQPIIFSCCTSFTLFKFEGGCAGHAGGPDVAAVQHTQQQHALASPLGHSCSSGMPTRWAACRPCSDIPPHRFRRVIPMYLKW